MLVCVNKNSKIKIADITIHCVGTINVCTQSVGNSCCRCYDILETSEGFDLPVVGEQKPGGHQNQKRKEKD